MLRFAWPYCLLLVFLPWLVYALLPAIKPSQTPALKVPFFHNLTALTVTHTQHSTRSAAWYWLYIVWCLLVIALANPQWVGPPQALAQRGYSMMLAIDISGSMEIPDMEWDGKAVDRFTAVKKIAKNFIKQREGDRIGLILFGTFAYLQTPLTFDRKTVTTQLEDASIGLAGPQTAIGDAIALAVKRLMKQDESMRILILLSDGANNSGIMPPKEALTLAKQNYIRIYTIGLGADHLRINSVFGSKVVNPAADLDEELLTTIAKKTKGHYFRAKDTLSLTKIYREIDRLEPIATKSAIFRPIQSLYSWPLGLAFILSILLVLYNNYMRKTAT